MTAQVMCRKHPDTAKIVMETGKKKLHVAVCPKCQAEKQAAAPPAPAPEKKTPEAAPPEPEKKRSFWSGW